GDHPPIKFVLSSIGQLDEYAAKLRSWRSLSAPSTARRRVVCSAAAARLLNLGLFTSRAPDYCQQWQQMARCPMRVEKERTLHPKLHRSSVVRELDIKNGFISAARMPNVLESRTQSLIKRLELSARIRDVNGL